MSRPQHTVVYVGPDEGLGVATEVLEHLALIKPVAVEQTAVEKALRHADGLVDASTRIPITADALAAAARLRIISCASTGSSHIDDQAARDRGVEIRTLREDRELLQGLTPAAELTWALVLACARQLPAAAQHVREGEWERERFPGVMLRGRRLGLIGCGRIGQWVARYARAFDMEVVGYDPHIKPWPDGIRQLSLEEVVASADVVSIHVHLNDETRGLVGRELLARVRPGGILINTSRGGIVDEVALLETLRDNRLAAAGLDVLAAEPDVAGDPLLQYAREHENLIITPHIGGFSPDAVRLVCRRAAEKVRAALEEPSA